MADKIIGNVVGIPNPKADWNQTDERKADYIKNKPTILTEDDVIELIAENSTGSGGETSSNATSFIVNVEVKWKAIKVSESGGVAQVKYDFVVTNADKSYDEICDAASNGMSVIASVFGAGHQSAMDVEKPTYTLCLTEYDNQLIGSGRAIFSGTINTDENVCEIVTLTLNQDINTDWQVVETWSVEKTTLPSKVYVDNQIGDIETAIDNIITIQNQILGVSE